jgi:hypothetical protein
LLMAAAGQDIGNLAKEESLLLPAPSPHLSNPFLGPLLMAGFIDCAGRGVVESDSVSSLVV